jgi:hypothetical protein
MNAFADTLFPQSGVERVRERIDDDRPAATTAASARADLTAFEYPEELTQNDACLPRLTPLARRATALVDDTSRYAYRLAIVVNIAVLGLVLGLVALLS